MAVGEIKRLGKAHARQAGESEEAIFADITAAFGDGDAFGDGEEDF